MSTPTERLEKALTLLRDGIPAIEQLEKSAESNPTDRRRLNAIRQFILAFAKSRNIPAAPGAPVGELVKAIAPVTFRSQTLVDGFVLPSHRTDINPQVDGQFDSSKKRGEPQPSKCYCCSEFSKCGCKSKTDNGCSCSADCPTCETLDCPGAVDARSKRS